MTGEQEIEILPRRTRILVSSFEVVRHLQAEGYRMLAIAVTKVHAHLLVELPGALDEVKAIIGSAKRY